ncbi:MBL fold metallo-hydrolase [Marinilabiliaceae bacterium JC017]|nr:MBL fold metallo-hydrolase [Marinilabiliaceae bacterium JC017]
MTEICALASGSNGNCYYIGNKDEAILIDAGISRRQVLKRMKLVGLDINKVKAVFISHEHSDHMKGVRVLSNLHQVAAYFTRETKNKCRRDHLPDKVNFFNPGEVVHIGGIAIHSFSKQHDAVDPCSFRVEVNDLQIGVMTDIGAPCDNVRQHLAMCDAVFLESNYDERLLMEGPYPYYLKQRVASEKGHLSNDQAVELIRSTANGKLKTIFLSHISGDNNRPDIALKAFEPVADKYEVIATSRLAPSEVYRMG